MSEHPKISIGMPVFNGSKYICDALDALLTQSFLEFELIISDNASEDGTQEICKRYAKQDRRIRYIRQSENIGAVKNFKFVLGEAKSDLFVWAAHDDQWMPNFLKTCYGLLKENSSAMYAMSAYESKSNIFAWLFRTKFRDPLSCIEIQDVKSRLLAYSSLKFETQKDNLVYALWRKQFLLEILSDIHKILEGRTLIGTAMNEYALFKSHGAYSPDVLFYKRYRIVPPGHWCATWLSSVSQIYSAIIGRQMPEASYNVSKFMIDLTKVLSLTNLPKDFQDELLELNKKNTSINS